MTSRPIPRMLADMRPPRWFGPVARLLRLPSALVPAGPARRRWPEAEDLPRRGRGRQRRSDEGGDDDRGDDDGGAGVREPRVPTGPRPSDAGAAPIPTPPQRISLPAEPEPR